MNFFKAIISNQALMSAFFAWLFCQSWKVFKKAKKEKKFSFKWFTLLGGFPSSHSASVSALATSIGLNYGFNSAIFALSSVFAIVVISDAQGIRRASGKQAEILNKIIDDLYNKRGFKVEYLKELIGHTPFEVFIGVILGISIAFLIYLF